MTTRVLKPTMDQFEGWVTAHEDGAIVGHSEDYSDNPYTRCMRDMNPGYRPVLLPERTLLVTKSYTMALPNPSWLRRFVFLTGPSWEGDLTKEDVLDVIDYLRDYA